MMSMWQHFHFLRPQWLGLGMLVFPLIWLLWNKVAVSNHWTRVCDPPLLAYLTHGQQQRQRRYPYFCLLLVWILTILALAGPTWEKRPQPVFSSLYGRIVVFDLSQSMNSTDLSPSRLVRARFKLADLIARGQGIQQALVVFAGDAFAVTPLTDDTETILNLIPALDTETVPVQGSRSDLGLALALALFENAGLTDGEVVMITDGVSPQTAQVAKEMASRGYPLSIIGVGTPQGAPVPLASGELLKDDHHNIVVPSIDSNLLTNIARLGNGTYRRLTTDNRDIDQLSTVGAGWTDWDRRSSPAEENIEGDQWFDYGIWLVFPILLLTAFSFRRGWILGILMLLVSDAMLKPQVGSMIPESPPSTQGERIA